jgi:hypothetical protein
MDTLPHLQQNGEKCSCAEAKYENKTGEIVPTGLHLHDCWYIKRRNSLIPSAAAYADLRVPDDRGGQRWTRAFSQHMKKLMREQEAAERWGSTEVDTVNLIR